MRKNNIPNRYIHSSGFFLRNKISQLVFNINHNNYHVVVNWYLTKKTIHTKPRHGSRKMHRKKISAYIFLGAGGAPYLLHCESVWCRQPVTLYDMCIILISTIMSHKNHSQVPPTNDGITISKRYFNTIQQGLQTTQIKLTAVFYHK